MEQVENNKTVTKTAYLDDEKLPYRHQDFAVIHFPFLAFILCLFVSFYNLILISLYAFDHQCMGLTVQSRPEG